MSYVYDPQRVTYFAATDCRNKQTPFGIRSEDRMRHMYLIGKTGMGKSTLLENMAIQDIQNGEGMCFIDPHGSTAEKLLDYVPEHRIKDVVYFAPFDTDFPVGFNVMEDVGYDKRHLVVSGLMSSFQRIWVDAWSARMEYILQNTLLALLEYPETTLIDVNHMLVNKSFRNKVTEYVTDPIVKRFWVEEFAGYTDRYTQEATPAIQNKIGQFTSNPLVRNIIGQPHSSFDIRKMMDEQKIFIVNLSKGRMGESNADLLGSILTTKMYLAAMSRAEESPARLADLPPFYLYVDEFQSVVNSSFANILSEARKYKLSLTIAHQYIEQVDEDIRAAVFGNVGSTITFRVGPFDAETLKTVFEPTFYAEDLVNLGFAQVYLTLMIDGVGSQPFSATTLPPVDHPAVSFRDRIIESSREQYSRPRAQIEELVRGHDQDVGSPKQNGNGGNTKKNGDKPRNNGQQRKEQQPRKEKPPLESRRKKEQPTEQGKHQQKQGQQQKQKEKPAERNALRDALAALQKAPKKEAQKKPQVHTQPRPQPRPQKEASETREQKQPPRNNSNQETSAAQMREVPRDTLRRLLDVEN